MPNNSFPGENSRNFHHGDSRPRWVAYYGLKTGTEILGSEMQNFLKALHDNQELAQQFEKVYAWYLLSKN